MFMNCNEVFSPIVEGKRSQTCVLGVYLWVMESIIDFTKKIPSLVSLLVSIVVNDLSGVENFIY